MKTKKEIFKFKTGDWISTTEIPLKSGQTYTNAFVKKVLKHGEQLQVVYGSYMSEIIVEAKNCQLLKRG